MARRGTWAFSIGLLAAVLSSASARAVAPEPIVLEYQATGDCPTADAFRREVLARTSTVRFVGSSPARVFRVRIERRDDVYYGTLDVASRSEPTAHREIDDERCDSVALVLAIAATLAVDPNANADPAPLRSEPPPTATPEPARAPRPPVRRAAIGVPQPSTRPREPEPRSSINLGAALSASPGPAPVTLIAPAAFVEYETRGASPWATLLRAQPLVEKTGLIGPEAPGAVFIRYSLRLSGCPLRLGGALFVSPCAVVNAGLLQAEGREGPTVTTPRQQTRPWLSLGLEARLAWDLSSSVFVEAAAGAELAVFRHDYVFQVPRRFIYSTPLISPALAAGFGVRFF